MEVSDWQTPEGSVWESFDEQLADGVAARIRIHKPDLRLTKVGPFQYDVNQRRVQLEVVTAAQGTKEVFVRDGPLRQPFVDYAYGSAQNVELADSALHRIPKASRLSFQESDIQGRIEAMRMATAEANAREKQAKRQLAAKALPPPPGLPHPSPLSTSRLGNQTAASFQVSRFCSGDPVYATSSCRSNSEKPSAVRAASPSFSPRAVTQPHGAATTPNVQARIMLPPPPQQAHGPPKPQLMWQTAGDVNASRSHGRTSERTRPRLPSAPPNLEVHSFVLASHSPMPPAALPSFDLVQGKSGVNQLARSQSVPAIPVASGWWGNAGIHSRSMHPEGHNIADQQSVHHAFRVIRQSSKGIGLPPPPASPLPPPPARLPSAPAATAPRGILHRGLEPRSLSMPAAHRGFEPRSLSMPAAQRVIAVHSFPRGLPAPPISSCVLQQSASLPALAPQLLQHCVSVPALLPSEPALIVPARLRTAATEAVEPQEAMNNSHSMLPLAFLNCNLAPAQTSESRSSSKSTSTSASESTKGTASRSTSRSES